MSTLFSSPPAPMCDEPHPLNRAKCYRDKGHDGQHEAYTQGRVFAWGRVIPARPISTSFLRDPSVVDWHIALAPVEPAPRRPHWWRELVTSTHRDARDAWEKLRESEPCLQMEDDEFRQEYPPPTLRDAMIALSTGGMPAPSWGGVL